MNTFAELNIITGICNYDDVHCTTHTKQQQKNGQNKIGGMPALITWNYQTKFDADRMCLLAVL